MCGICGLYGVTARESNHRLVDAMRAAIRHRGPDQGSTDAFGPCVLGHQRLCVIDLTTGEQPVTNESGDVVAVFNGELYNFRPLREELAGRGHEVRGTGDTPVIPHLYEEHGPRFVERLDGMFALAVWDARRRRLLLARDRLGKKPLLWTRLPDGTFAFASELKALLTLPDLPREVDLDAVDEYLALQYVRGERTALRGVRRVPPGHVLLVDADEERVERYWQPRPVEEHLPDDEWLERVRDTVRAAVRRRLVADVPLGALLSGGTDSSVVVALMAEASGEPVRTFTVGFPDARYDERAYAASVARRFDTVHTEVEVEADVAETVERLAQTFDEPFGDEAAFPTFLICEQARGHVTVALTGDGGDESFAGYERYAAQALAERVPALPARAGARLLRALPRGRTEPRSTAFRGARLLEAAAAPSGERYTQLMEVFPRSVRAELWADGTQPHRVRLDLPRPGLRGLQLLDLATYLPGALLPKADLSSMAHSLELRSPLLDPAVVELGLGLPERLKLRGREGKVALRRAFRDVLPPEVASRGKSGFGVPLGRWFRSDLRALTRDVLLDERARDRGWFRTHTVQRLLDEHGARRADHGHRLWCLLMLELWLRTHVEQRAAVLL